MTLDRGQMTRLAERLADARALATPCQLEAVLQQRLDEDEAYLLQQALVRTELARGRHLVGAKVGGTNPGAQQMLGCREPFFGWLLDGMEVLPGTSVASPSLIRPRIECELAFRLEGELQGPGVRRDDVLAGTSWVAAAFEIIDCRVTGGQPSLCELIADNSNSAAYVLSDRRVPPADLPLAGIAVTFRKNKGALGEGVSGAVMGHPADSVAWLANHLSAHGSGLPAGLVVLTGAIMPATPASPGDLFEADFGPLGPLAVSFSA